MAGDGRIGLHQLFQQRMAKEHHSRLQPQRAVGDKKPLPVALTQRRPQGRGGLEQDSVFVEQGERVTQWPTHRTQAIAGDGLGLQGIQAGFGTGKAQPTQAIEEIMQVVPRGHPALGINERLVGLPWRQFGLGHKASGRGGRQALPGKRLVARQGLRHPTPLPHEEVLHGFPPATPGGEPRSLPIERRQHGGPD